MEVSSFSADKDWKAPVFKVLAHNDTGAARGHQAGFLIPKALRKYMPALAGVVDAMHPTLDKRIRADLFLEDRFMGQVNTRYQFQTWAATRKEESRITDELGPIHKPAEGGDILVIQRSQKEDRFRLTLVRKTSPLHAKLKVAIGRRRWGQLFHA